MRKRRATSTSHSGFSFFPGRGKPGRGAYKHVVMGKSVPVRMENSQERKIKVGFGSSLGAEV